jgi:hypothetical protein
MEESCVAAAYSMGVDRWDVERVLCLRRRKTRVARERRPDDDGMARGLARSLAAPPPIKAARCVIGGPCL